MKSKNRKSHSQRNLSLGSCLEGGQAADQKLVCRAGNATASRRETRDMVLVVCGGGHQSGGGGRHHRPIGHLPGRRGTVRSIIAPPSEEALLCCRREGMSWVIGVEPITEGDAPWPEMEGRIVGGQETVWPQFTACRDGP